MELTKAKLQEAKIIFNHIPKAGGTSLYYFFQELFGAERCFRHSARDSKTGRHSPPIGKVPPEELEQYRFLQGHFDFGNHRRFNGPVLYLGVMRDPVDRVISDYYYNKRQGRKDLMEQANSMTLEEYIRAKMENPKSRLVTSAQTVYLSGQPSAEKAKEIIAEWYLACCTIDQLDDMQRMLARLFDRPDLAPTRVNETTAKKTVTEIGPEMLAELKERFAEDYELLPWVRERFETVYRDLTLADAA